jgi:hypothetical protein
MLCLVTEATKMITETATSIATEDDKQEKETTTLSATFDVVPVVDQAITDEKERKIASDKIYAELRRFINTYRGTDRIIANMAYMAECASATVAFKTDKDGNETVTVKPDSEKAKAVTSLLFDKQGKAHLYELLPEASRMLAGYRSDFANSALRDVGTWWRSKDQEFRKARKGWLAMQGTRRPPLFQFAAIPFRGVNDQKAMTRIKKHSIFLSLKPGEWIEFKLVGKKSKKNGKNGRIDGYLWHIFRSIRDGQIDANTTYLHESDGRFRIRMSYKAPVAQHDLKKNRISEVGYTTNSSEFMQIRMNEGHQPSEGLPIDDVRSYNISILAAIDHVDRLAIQRDLLMKKKRSCGNPNAGSPGEGNAKANRAITDRLERLTRHRDNSVKNWNNCWSRRIIDEAVRWGCGGIRVFGPPKQVSPNDPRADQGLLGRPWQWASFRDMVKNKAEQAGIVVEFVAPPSDEEVNDAIKSLGGK